MTATHHRKHSAKASITNVSRRSILKFMSAGAVGLGLGTFHLSALEAEEEQIFLPNAFLEIHPNNEVHFWCKRTEMGQLIKTGLAVIIADELGADLEALKIHQATADEKYGFVGTGGSGATIGAWRYYRPMFAAAREMLISAAAASWSVEVGDCFAEGGEVVHRPTGKKLAFGELAVAAAKLPVPEAPTLKPLSDLKYVGKSRGRLDASEVVTGAAVYGADIVLPGMKFVSVERCPVRGGKLLSVETTVARALSGVVDVLTLGDKVAVVAQNSWAAMRARELLNIEWDYGENQFVDSEQLDAQLMAGLDDAGYLIRETGVAAQSEASVSYVYEIPAASHAPLETATATAVFKEEVLSIWSSCHMQTPAVNEVSKLTGLGKEKINLQTTLAGGSFGRKLTRDYILEVAEVAMKVPYPVQLLYTREDDSMHGPNRPPTKHKVSFTLNEAGKAVGCEFHMSGFSVAAQEGPGGIDDRGFDWTAALGANDIPYSFDHIRISHKMHNSSALYFTWWRGTYRNHNCFALECAVDELAVRQNKDPIDLRLEHLGQDIVAETFPGDTETVSAARMQRLLKALRGQSSLEAPRRAGHAVGVACHCYTDVYSYSAFAVEVSVEVGEVTVHKVTAVIDCGLTVNPSAVRAQVEGGIVFGLSGAIAQETTLKNGRVQQLNFDSSPVLRMAECPEIAVHILPSDEPPGGVGEPALTPLMPAFMNAVSRASGKRIRRLPLGDQLAGGLA